MWPSCGDPFTLHSHLHPQPVLPSLHECLSAHNHGDFQVDPEGWAISALDDELLEANPGFYLL